MINKKDIRIEYDYKYTSLCNGNLVVYVDGKKWRFPSGCLVSGGSIDLAWGASEEITEGPWNIESFPEGFPEELKSLVIDIVNEKIPHGCCGQCA